MEPDGRQADSPRKACISCHKEFTGDMTVCPEDGTRLTTLKDDSLVGHVLADKYEVLSLVGEGGMGRVYKGRHKLMKRIVAIKTMHRNLVSSTGTLKRFQQEAESVSLLSHPNLVSVYDFGLTEEGQPYLVMDFLQGKGLDEVIQDCKCLATKRCLPIFVQACLGLSHAHKKGVIHRDIKPSNIMLIDDEEEGEQVKILDFGIAKRMPREGEEITQLTQTGDVFGSPLYMSPEQCRAGEMDERTDVYSLGCVLYQCLTGKQPFSGVEFVEILMKHVSESPQALKDVCPETSFPEGLESLLFKAMAKEKEDRFQSMSEFKSAIESVLAGNGMIEVLPDYTSVSSPAAQNALSGALPESSDQTSERATVSRRGETAASAGQSVEAENVESTVESKGTVSGLPEQRSGFLSAKVVVGIVLVAIVVVIGLIKTQIMPVPSWLGGNPADEALTMARQKFDSGNYQEARKFARQAETIASKKGSESIELAESLYLLGLVSYAQGEYPAAQDLLSKALSVREKREGDSTPEVAMVKVALGRTLSAQGQAAKAEQMIGPAIQTIEGSYGSADLRTADAFSALADSLLRQAKYDKAIQSMNQALEIREDSAGRDSVIVANSYNDLGQAYQLKGDFKEAKSLYEKALDIRRKKLGENNPQVANTLICLGALSERKGDFSQAAGYYQQAIAIQEKTMGPANPALVSTRQLYDRVQKRAGSSGRGGKSGMILKEVKGR